MKKKIGKDLLDAKPPQQLLPSRIPHLWGLASYIHTGERNSVAVS